MLFSSFICSVAALVTALFCRMLGIFIILPVASALAIKLPHGGGVTAGLLLGGYGLTQALMQIPFGLMADRIGKKTVLLLALMLFAAGGFVAAAADTVYGMIGGRLLQGSGAVAATALAWLADISPPHRRAPAMAAFGAMIMLAFISSLIVAPLLVDTNTLADIFYLTGWLGTLSFILVLLLPPPPAKATRQGNISATLGLLLGNRALIKISGGAFILHYTLATLFFILPVTLELPTAMHWQVYAAGFAAALPVVIYLIMRVDKKPKQCLAAAIGFMIAACLLLPAASATVTAIAVLFLFFSGFIALEAALPAQATKVASEQHRAAAMGIMMTCQFFGVFCGGALAGIITAFAGATAAVAAACLLLALWLGATVKK